ncbi:hypothetical protein ACOSP7_009661 [Xanthoceras sorbifolium]
MEFFLQLESESTETESDIWRHSYEFVMQDMFGDMFGDMFMSDVEDVGDECHISEDTHNANTDKHKADGDHDD